MRKYNRPVPDNIKLSDPVFAERLEACIKNTVPAAMSKIVETGRLDAFRLNWQEGQDKKPHIFWDSDTAKVLEGMAYSLALHPDPELEKIYDQWVDLCLDMPVRVIRSNPQITGNNGRIALKRGPMVYALEQTDNEAPVREIIIDTGCGFELAPAGNGLGQNAIAITGRAVREYFSDCEELYTDAEPQYENVSFKAIPYALWQNRGECNMAVWVRAK